MTPVTMKPGPLLLESLRSGTIASLAIVPLAPLFKAAGLRIGHYGPKFAGLFVDNPQPWQLFVQHIVIGWVSALPLLILLLTTRAQRVPVLAGAIYGAAYYVAINSLALPIYFKDPLPWQLGAATVWPSLLGHVGLWRCHRPGIQALRGPSLLHLSRPSTMKTAHDLVLAAKSQCTEVPVKDAPAAVLAADVVIDVREPDEYAAGHLTGALNIPRGLLEFKLSGTPALDKRDLNVVLYCKTSGRAALAAVAMQDMGYLNVVSVAGGFEAWTAAGLPFVKPTPPVFE